MKDRKAGIQQYEKLDSLILQDYDEPSSSHEVVIRTSNIPPF